MPIEMRLTAEQFPHYEAVLTKAKITYKNRGLLIELGADNHETILTALKAAHMKSLLLKTKTPLHMERLYNLQQVIARIEELIPIYFPTNDNEEVVVEPTEGEQMLSPEEFNELAERHG